MDKLDTPFGFIDIQIDGKSIPYEAREGRRLKYLCPNVLGRYQIEIQFIPDGKEHTISCVFNTPKKYKAGQESGENLESQGFYSEDRYKMSIGLLCDIWGYINGEYTECYNDCGIDYLHNGMVYHILEGTETETYIFGISWIDDVGWDDPITRQRQSRAAETWSGADPSLEL